MSMILHTADDHKGPIALPQFEGIDLRYGSKIVGTNT